MNIEAGFDCIRFQPNVGWLLDGRVRHLADATPLVVEIDDERTTPAIRIASSVLVPPGDGSEIAFSLPLPQSWHPSPAPLPVSVSIDTGVHRVAGRVDVPVMAVAGWVDGCRGALVEGWACNGFDPDRPVVLDMMLDGMFVDRVCADRHRGDLEGIGAGRNGFRWIVPDAFLDGKTRHLVALPSNGYQPVPGPAIPVAFSRADLSGEARRLLLLRLEAFDALAGVPPRDREEPFRPKGPAGADSHAAHSRFASAPRSGPVAMSPGEPLPEAALSDLDTLFASAAGQHFAPIARGGITEVDRGVVAGLVDYLCERPPLLEILVDGQSDGYVTANETAIRHRYAFAHALSAAYADGLPHAVETRLANMETPLPGTVRGVVFDARDRSPAVASFTGRRSVGLHCLRWLDEALATEAGKPAPAPRAPLVLPHGGSDPLPAPADVATVLARLPPAGPKDLFAGS